MTTLVIGAGPAGLAAVKSLKEAGLPVRCVEKNADVGGQWLYGAPASAVYASTHLISSKRTTAYADFPMPEDWPAYPGHAQVSEYFKFFAKHFDLYSSISFNTDVRKIEQRDGSWRATFGDGTTDDFENVIFANGHLSDPLMPKITGEFSGKLMHAKDYKTADIFEDKRVLVVGMGNTGCDIVVDAIHRAKKVLWSVRGGNHFVPKFLAGKPADEGNHKPKRFIVPRRLRSMLHEPILRFLVGRRSASACRSRNTGFTTGHRSSIRWYYSIWGRAMSRCASRSGNFAGIPSSSQTDRKMRSTSFCSPPATRLRFHFSKTSPN
jgi:cation diffusion facilitator CzcD-associated flavoprotein CzcO